ncbi:MAG TPA: DEAD/DEAH box helicase [Ilumatobacteraceae bacterium]|nr:DEAD/DEAH box helicase [Ilumatobacteraceae bacterium]
MSTLESYLTAAETPRSADGVIEAMVLWSAEHGRSLYPHQEEAILELLSGNNVILATPTGSGKSTVALAAHAMSRVADTPEQRRRSWYTAPVKALVSEKFFDLCQQLGPEHVGMMTGDSSINPDAAVMCCTTEILAFMALRDGALADADTVVLDEFHFYADPDRGWAWQVPLLEMSRATFLLLSATLGDTRTLAEDLTRRTGRATVTVDRSVRPVPLRYAVSCCITWSRTCSPPTRHRCTSSTSPRPRQSSRRERWRRSSSSTPRPRPPSTRSWPASRCHQGSGATSPACCATASACTTPACCPATDAWSSG